MYVYVKIFYTFSCKFTVTFQKIYVVLLYEFTLRFSLRFLPFISHVCFCVAF